jgi:hypothetical protein
MVRTGDINISSGNTAAMTICKTASVLALVLAVLMCSGCVQPDRRMVQETVTAGTDASPAPVLPSSAPPAGQDRVLPVSIATPSTTGSVVQVPTPGLITGTPEPGGFLRFTGAEYSLEYPAAWSANRTVSPLREYRHEGLDCTVSFAYNLDQELRMYSSPDGRTIFYSGVVNTQRDIWPRTVQSRVVYEDIVNAVLGNPESCANLEGNKAFTIAGISQVPLDGVSYTGVRVDFARVNLTGFTEGTGTMYVVTGQDHRGVFTFYSTSLIPDAQADLARYMFDSLRLDSGF